VLILSYIGQCIGCELPNFVIHSVIAVSRVGMSMGDLA